MKPRSTAVLVGGMAATAVWIAARVARDRLATAHPEPGVDLTGAGLPLLPAPQRRSAPVATARVTAPAWEPPVLARLAAWEPATPAGLVTRVLAVVWAAPLSLLGLVVGFASAATPQVRDGVLLFATARGVPGAVLKARGFAATTLGHVVVATGRPEPALMAHELVHTRQAERFGPLFGPLYIALLAVYGYARHPMERAARRAGRRVLGAPA